MGLLAPHTRLFRGLLFGRMKMQHCELTMTGSEIL